MNWGEVRETVKVVSGFRLQVSGWVLQILIVFLRNVPAMRQGPQLETCNLKLATF
jgi:hypothetical protein